jgi:hypothetical protein
MKKWLHKVEYITDRIIPYTLIVLFIIIIIDILFKENIGKYVIIIEILDGIIITIFLVDLYFKYQRVKNFKKFLRKYWLDIIAVFPLFLVFRMFEEIVILSNLLKESLITGQKVVHEGVEVEKLGAKFVEAASKETKFIEGIEKEGMKLVREAEQAGRISRTGIFTKIIEPITRAIRFTKFGSKETEKEVEKEVEKGEKLFKKGERKTKKLVKEGEKLIESEVKNIKKAPRIVNAFVFYERPKKIKIHN